MTTDLNKVIISGRMVKKPELKTIQRTGHLACNFTIAVNKHIPKTKQQITQFIDCCAYTRRAEIIAEYFDVGDEIFIVGRLRVNLYEKGRTTYKTVTVDVDDFYFGSRKKGGSQSGAGSEEIPMPTEEDIYATLENVDEGDLPF